MSSVEFASPSLTYWNDDTYVVNPSSLGCTKVHDEKTNLLLTNILLFELLRTGTIFKYSADTHHLEQRSLKSIALSLRH